MESVSLLQIEFNRVHQHYITVKQLTVPLQLTLPISMFVEYFNQTV